MFTILWRLLAPLWPLALAASLMGAASGLAAAGLLAATNRALNGGAGLAGGLLLAFAGLCAMTLIGEVASDIGTNVVGQRVIARLRRDLCARVLTAPIAGIERYKLPRLIATLNGDVETIAQLSFVFSSLVIAAAVTLGCLAYLAMLSPALCGVTIVALFVGAAGHVIARHRGLEIFNTARANEDDLQKHYRAIVDGAKELRLNRIRRARVFDDQLVGAIERIRGLRTQAINVFVTANAFGSLVFFVVIGLILVLGNSLVADQAALSGFVLVLLYMKGPVNELVNALPLLGRAQVSARRIAELAAEFESPEPHLAIDGVPMPATTVDTIELRGAAYRFPGGFQLGPVDLTIRRGELVFVTGENGSGKTTLIKLLTGLYHPTAGQVLLDGQVVTPERLDDYRQLFSAVFFDYHLFDDLVFRDDALPAEIEQYLERLELAAKVTIRDGVFSTTDLSTGQRKRLALIQVYLDRRPILVFDEWAAEQDPTFRRVFYTELLPELKARGKTVIVVSHDDRYFHVADRRLTIAAGLLVVAEPTISPTVP
ncbi:MAG: cyclic peptide export ABC transporter [Ferrovibrionaceae bacterium]